MNFNGMSTGLVRKTARSMGIPESETAPRSRLIRQIQKKERKPIERLLFSAGDAGINFLRNCTTLMNHEIK